MDLVGHLACGFAFYLVLGSGWTGQRVVTTNNNSSSDLATILGTIEKVYDVSTENYTGGDSSYNSARKRKPSTKLRT